MKLSFGVMGSAFRACAFAIALAALAGTPDMARAATLTVCSSGCAYTSIQAAVDAAVSGDTVDIAAGTFNENFIVIEGGQDATGQMTRAGSGRVVHIRGAGEAATIVQGSNTAPQFYLNFRAPVVTMTGLTVSGGTTGIVIGGGTLDATQITVTGASASGIQNQATLSLADCSVVDNAGWEGGGLQNWGTATLENCLVSGNTASGQGGGIWSMGTLSLDRTRVENNESLSSGGGIYNYNQGTTILVDSTVSGNAASFYAGSDGGGIYSWGTLIVTRSTISGNATVRLGGGIYVTGTGASATVVNSTLSGNVAGDSGGGVFASFAGASLASSTVTANIANGTGSGYGRAGGVRGHGAGVILRNSIVAGNVGVAPDCSGAVVSQGYNLIGIGDNSECGLTSGTGDIIGTAASPIDPLLGPLTDNGGPTDTHALLSGSSAAESGAPVADGGCTDFDGVALTSDQRGELRPQGAACDIGAYESDQVIVASTGGGGRKDVDAFIAFASPTEKTTSLPAGTASFNVTIVYGQTIDPATFEAKLNRSPAISLFHPAPGAVETVTIPLSAGRNVLVVSVSGINSAGRTSKDSDRLTFVVK